MSCYSRPPLNMIVTCRVCGAAARPIYPGDRVCSAACFDAWLLEAIHRDHTAKENADDEA